MAMEGATTAWAKCHWASGGLCWPCSPPTSSPANCLPSLRQALHHRHGSGADRPTALLAESYRPGECAKVQALNDFLVFGMLAMASLGSGQLLHSAG